MKKPNKKTKPTPSTQNLIRRIGARTLQHVGGGASGPAMTSGNFSWVIDGGKNMG